MILKVLSFNIHKGFGWHRFISTFKAIDQHIQDLSPDFIFFQEILGTQAEYIVFDRWPHYSYGKNVVFRAGHFGNAIFSRFPIIFSENFDLSTYRLEQRGLLHSIVNLPNEKRLHLLCVHLGLFRRSRQKQYEKIISYIKSTISNDEPIILGGDFNDWGSHATLPLQSFGLQEAFMQLHRAYARTFPAWAPLLKLDRIYTRGIEIISADRLMQKSWRILSDHIAITIDFNLQGIKKHGKNRSSLS